jgi:endonuclease YncB( thermonuclease family)
VKFMTTLAAVVLGAAVSFATTAEALMIPWIDGQASVVDGDTIEVHGQRIRFAYIDAPDSDQICGAADGTTWRCGSASAFFLADLIGEKMVNCHVFYIDEYGRAIATCTVDGESLNARLVSEGLAVAERHYSEQYVPQEDAARAEGLGMWQGNFDMPWDWRRR